MPTDDYPTYSELCASYLRLTQFRPNYTAVLERIADALERIADQREGDESDVLARLEKLEAVMPTRICRKWEKGQRDVSNDQTAIQQMRDALEDV